MASSSSSSSYKNKEIIDTTVNDESDGSDHEQDGGVILAEPSTSSSVPKKKKKKKSKARSMANKLKAGISSVAVPQELVDAVMDKVKEEQGGEHQIDEAEVRKAMKAMKVLDILNGKAALGAHGKKDLGEHRFWRTQPVPQIGEEPAKESGPIEPSLPPEEVRQEPYPLPKDFEWSTVDINDAVQCKEVYELLSANYVEDDEANFRFAYTAAFLAWALKPPGYHPLWHVGVRVSSTKKLVAFISGIPMELRVRNSSFKGVEINFLCVHKKLRSKRLAPLLIKEVTRRCHVLGIFQAIYTAGVVLPTPVSTCRYFHRTINVRKLVDVGFTHVARSQTLARMIRQAQLPETTTIVGLREMGVPDVPQVHALMDKYMKRFDMAPVYSPVEVEHTFLSGKGTEPYLNKHRRTDQVVWAYVVEDQGRITDFISFYTLPSTIIDQSKGHKVLDAAYLFYYASEAPEGYVLKNRLHDLVGDALIIAGQAGFDVLNALTLMDNVSFLEDHKFGRGDGLLNYYLYNWRTPPLEGHIPHPANQGGKGAGRGVGVVML